MRFVVVDREHGVSLHRVVKKDDIKIPEVGTKMHRCFRSLAVVYPRKMCTKDVALDAKLTPKETSALLVALMARGLVDQVERRRGLQGGSIWQLSLTAHQLLNK